MRRRPVRRYDLHEVYGTWRGSASLYTYSQSPELGLPSNKRVRARRDRGSRRATCRFGIVHQVITIRMMSARMRLDLDIAVTVEGASQSRYRTERG